MQNFPEGLVGFRKTTVKLALNFFRYLLSRIFLLLKKWCKNTIGVVSWVTRGFISNLIRINPSSWKRIIYENRDTNCWDPTKTWRTSRPCVFHCESSNSSRILFVVFSWCSKSRTLHTSPACLGDGFQIFQLHNVHQTNFLPCPACQRCGVKTKLLVYTYLYYLYSLKHSHGKSSILMVFPRKDGGFSMAMLVYRRVILLFTNTLVFNFWISSKIKHQQCAKGR